MSQNLGDFEQLLLFAVLRLGDDAYGVRIRQEIEARTARSVSSGAVYTGLDRLRTRGLVSSREGDATPVRGGRRKRYYRLEPEGAAALEGAWDDLRGMAEGVLFRLRELAARVPSGGGA
ncbi:MAG TPA: helix-turn-helix transcriptional regulator [Longimicrobiales bacterium]|nr:helix-turn-helix transcriptional regulator [Longimicrobiales bacterium]